jgi:hypothetical protein
VRSTVAMMMSFLRYPKGVFVNAGPAAVIPAVRGGAAGARG